MNISLCLYGFIRDIENVNNINIIVNNIKFVKIDKLTIYYSCPNKIEETSDNFDENEILRLFKIIECEKIEVKIVFRNYDKCIFVEKAISLNYPRLTSNKLHSYRALSCLYGISETMKLVDKECDYIIVSRLDIIHFIISFNNVFNVNEKLINTAYIWRTIPYISKGENEFHVEDRFFICSYDCIPILQEVYDNIGHLVIDEKKLCSEIILGIVFNQYNNLNKFHLHNLILDINKLNNYTMQRVSIKYSKTFLDEM